MSPLAVGPVLALIGIVAAFFVLRGKAKTRKSMYRTLRERREHELRKARERATSARGAAEKAAMEKEAAAQAAAAPPPAPASTAALGTPTQEAPAAPPPAPLYTPQAPTYTPPEPPPVPPPAPPIEQAPAEALPEPPPTAGNAKPAWEIVQPQKADAEDIQAKADEGPGAGKASWELDPREQQRIDDRHKGREWHGGEEEDDNLGEETLPQVLLSYAGLVVALLVILLGILFMIGAKATN
jgi:hypothetical protein